MNYQLIALDLDGTLCNDDKQITPITKQVLLRAQQKGIRVALASARPAPGLIRERKALELDRYHGILISYNGAHIVDAADGSLLYRQNMDPAQVTAMLTHLKDFPVAVMADDGESYYVTDPTAYKVEYERAYIGIPFTVVADMAEAVTFPVAKLLIVAPGEILDRYTAAITAPFSEIFDFFRVGDFYLEIAMKGFSKATGLAELCQKLDIPREAVIAFGDSANDAAMLNFAGTGVAMANAEPAAKKAADTITRYTNNEDGVGRMLMELL
ncbi:Cof-type HAD-IIB family hydrolase [Eubacterium sp.]|uniref:Cof-type HAD-IIB family hydrolase n=1 Tax=Eubacterium sp. TaxID=142586 RepID=UPI002FC658E6